jgi:hypothetical protein
MCLSPLIMHEPFVHFSQHVVCCTSVPVATGSACDEVGSSAKHWQPGQAFLHCCELLRVRLLLLLQQQLMLSSRYD